MSTPAVLTFGCRLNAHESDAMAHYARGQDDIVIVNTCTVTATAERQARQAIRRVHRERPDARIVVTGCASERDAAAWAQLPGVARVIPNDQKLQPQLWGQKTPSLPPSRHCRALLQIQQGCDHRCTFCVIPFGRGDSRSTPSEDVLARARALTEAGHREIVLTGVDIASWREEGRQLGALCRLLLRSLPDLERLRLSSVDPVLLDVENGDRDLWALLAEEPRFMPHLHLSLQAGSDLILKRMKRRHTRAGVGATIAKARALRPEIGFGADLIAGFPTETEALFEETLRFIDDQAIPFLHVFPYSERPGTPAARMPALPNARRQERAARLRDAGTRHRDLFLGQRIGRRLPVLFETPEGGHTPAFAPLRLADGETAQRGTIALVEVQAVENGLLRAKRV